MRLKFAFPVALLVSGVLVTLLTGCALTGTATGAGPLPTLVAPAQFVQPVEIETRPVPPTFTPPPVGSPAGPTQRLLVTTAPTFTPRPSPTAGPYAGLTIADLSTRAYGGGTLEMVAEMGRTAAFTRYLVRYPSDGLTIYGFMNVPAGEGPFPVVVALHGYIEPEEYETLDYTASYADHLATNGYLVVHPNFRNYLPSDAGPNAFRVGYAVDTLNLLAIIRAQAGRPGALAAAMGDNIHLWGHSMGGGVALRVLTVDPAVRSAVLYGSMSGDEQRNFEQIIVWSEGEDGRFELDTPANWLAQISPQHFYNRITAVVSIHHGQRDGIVPWGWSAELCEDLRGWGKTVECNFYPEQPHIFGGEGNRLFRGRVLDFYNRYAD